MANLAGGHNGTGFTSLLAELDQHGRALVLLAMIGGPQSAAADALRARASRGPKRLTAAAWTKEKTV